MRLDEQMLAQAVKTRPHTFNVRVYGWSHKALSVGRNTQVTDDIRARCTNSMIEIVRRPTGGGAVLHTDDVTYAVAGPHGSMGVLETYILISKPLIAALADVGIEAMVVTHPKRADALSCFAKPTGADLEVDGAKLCGSAQVRRLGYFLQHGSIPFTNVTQKAGELLGVEAGDSTSISEAAPELEWMDVANAIKERFSDLLQAPKSLVTCT